MRLPLANTLQSRDGLVDKDAKVVNGILEPKGDTAWVRNRPGNTTKGLLKAGVAQLLYCWNGVLAIIDDFLIRPTAYYSAVTATFNTAALSASARWGGIAFGGGRYVTISTSGATSYSTDYGATWVAGGAVTARNWWRLTYGNGVFVAIAYDSTATAVSADGVTWNEASGRLPSTGFFGMATDGTTFVTTNNGSRNAATSTDGVAWTSHVNALPNTGTAWQFVAWNGEVYCATQTTGGFAATSLDGITWTARTLSETVQMNALVGGNGIFITAPFTGGSNIASVSSDNGVTWTDSTLPIAAANSYFTDGVWTGDCFILITQQGTTSAPASVDGVTWSTLTLPNFGSTMRIASAGIGYAAICNLGGGNNTFLAYATNVLVTPTITSTQTNLNPTTPDLQFSAQDNGANAATDLVMFKNRTQAWTLSGGSVLTQITDVDYPGSYTASVTSLTRSGTVATAATATDVSFQVGDTVTVAGATPAAYNGAVVVTGVVRATTITSPSVAISLTRSGTTATATCTSTAHGFVNGESVTISGANESAYNGTYTITYISGTQFSYTVVVTSTLPATPATGSPALTNTNSGQGLVTGGASTWTWVGTLAALCGTPQVGETIQIVSAQGIDQLIGSATVTVSAGGIDFTFSKATTYSSGTGSITFTRTAPVISSITRSGTTVTVTTASAHGFFNGQSVSISGATQTQYNGTFVVTRTGANTFTYELAAESPTTPATGSIFAQKPDTVSGASFTYTIAGSPATPATGTITASQVKATVPGIAYLDGYFAVMDTRGVIYNSASDDPQTWNPLDYTTALNESGAGVALAKSLNYVVAFKEFSTEFFYNDTTVATGSPLKPVESGFTQIGCASGTSLALLDGSLYWMAQTIQEGRSVFVMNGIQQQKVSTPDVERVLNRDDLSDVFAYGMKLDGHSLYVLTLSDITLVFDATSQSWTQWSSLTIGSSVSVSSITRSETTATVTTATAHGVSDGDPVKISGATQTDYNGIFQAQVISSTVFTIQVENSPTTPATGTILSFPYTESYFKFTHYTGCDGENLLLHESDGYLYEILSTLYQDNGAPISILMRSTRIDGGSLEYKAMSRAMLVGDSVADTAMIRYSDDDMQTSVSYRPLNLADDEPMIRQMGRFRRRTLETRYVGNNPINLLAMEVETS